MDPMGDVSTWEGEHKLNSISIQLFSNLGKEEEGSYI